MKETVTKPLLFTGHHLSKVFKFSQNQIFKKASARLAKDLQCHSLYPLPAVGFHAQSFLHQHDVEQLMCEGWVWPSYRLEVLWEARLDWIPRKGLPMLGLLGQYFKMENVLQSLQQCALRASLKETPHHLHDAWGSSVSTNMEQMSRKQQFSELGLS